MVEREFLRHFGAGDGFHAVRQDAESQSFNDVFDLLILGVRHALNLGASPDTCPWPAVRSDPQTQETEMEMWTHALDEIHAIEREDVLTVDQRIRVVEIKALLSIGQELSLIHHQGINPEFTA
ncbi:hypothetical protein [Aeromicrobium sp.]|uniref:hypothetical protein n=1 Tax=Aeromicrobium sp. TaxID=1871063 RepID=UPI002FCA48CD